jgi:hypothetical protein
MILASALSPLAASAASAQHTDLPDTVIALGESVEIDLDGDRLPDLAFFVRTRPRRKVL